MLRGSWGFLRVALVCPGSTLSIRWHDGQLDRGGGGSVGQRESKVVRDSPHALDVHNEVLSVPDQLFFALEEVAVREPAIRRERCRPVPAGWTVGTPPPLSAPGTVNGTANGSGKGTRQPAMQPGTCSRAGWISTLPLESLRNTV